MGSLFGNKNAAGPHRPSRRTGAIVGGLTTSVASGAAINTRIKAFEANMKSIGRAQQRAADTANTLLSKQKYKSGMKASAESAHLAAQSARMKKAVDAAKVLIPSRIAKAAMIGTAVGALIGKGKA